MDSRGVATVGNSLCAMEINGVPLHPLVVHAAVVFVPTAALLAMLFLVPRWRWLARWPAVVLAVVGAVTVQVAVMTGQTFEHIRHVETLPLVKTHITWGHRLQIAMWIFAVIMVVAFWALPYVTSLSGAANRESRVAALEKPLLVIVPLAAVAVLVLVVLTGDAGARAVWKQ
jgi:phosphoglycerol transferase MdoB-like AlkP superfamily enzyme